MARSTKVYTKYPWNGGTNSALDPGAISDNDLVQGENIVFASSGARIKREGWSYFDSASDIPAVTHRASSGTTRTLTFASDLQTSAPDNHKIVVGERLNVVTTASGNEPGYYDGEIVVLTVSTNTLTYDASLLGGTLSESATATSTLSLTRAKPIIGLHDYWRFVPSTAAKTQLLMGATSQHDDENLPALPKLFKYDSDGRRSEVTTDELKASWPSIINRISMGVINEDLIVAFDGKGNRPIKYNPEDSAKFTLLRGGTSQSVASSAGLVTEATNVINITAHGFIDDQAVLFIGNIGGLTTQTVYYVDYVGVDSFKLAATAGGAAIDLTDDGTGTQQFHTLAPQFSIMGVHLDRLWVNDKTNPDRVYYSSTGNHEEWFGVGDSGALDIISGDGDSKGITAIFPSFKGSIFVAKGNKLYEINGADEDDFAIHPLTHGLGAVSHNSVVAVDVDDVVFVSRKGFHSLLATDQHGDFQGSYLSSKIQPTFNLFPASRHSYVSAAYVPSLNSVAFALTDEGGLVNNALWFYNTQFKEWYTWPDADAQIVCVYEKSSVPKLFYGTATGQIVETQNGEFTDFDEDPIRFLIKSGSIYPDNEPLGIKGFKRVGLIFKPRSSYSFTVTIKIDNFPAQSHSFSQSLTGDRLDIDFTLGQSVLGHDFVMAPFAQSIDGYGRGLTLQVENNTEEQQVEIYGYTIEYEPGDIAQETITDLPEAE